MLFAFRLAFLVSLAAFQCSSGAAASPALVISNGVHTYSALAHTTVTMTGRAELRLTAASAALSGCVVQLNSVDAWLLLPNIKPSAAASSYLSQIRVSGAAASADNNIRVVPYGMGSAMIPHPASLRPLQVFAGPHFTGASMPLSQYTAYAGAVLGPMSGTISSFKLMRGYMATMAENENGAGASQCYVAQEADLEVSLLPPSLDDRIRFVRIFPWRWVSKKGIAGNIWQNLNVGWFYNWNLNQNSSRDVEYVAIRQSRWWPGLNQDWRARGINHLLGYNEPDHPDQADMSVGDAIDAWPDLLGTGLRVGAPAVTDGGSSWLYSFIDRADAAGLRVDFVPVHYYRCYSDPANPDGAATQFYSFLKSIHDRVQRPLWVTEWNNGANWTGCADPTFAQQQAAVAQMIQMLDQTPFVERYAIYNWVEDVRRVQWDDGSLTGAGVAYRDQVSPIAHVQTLPDNASRGIAQFPFENSALDRSGFGNNAMPIRLPAYSTGRTGLAIELDGVHSFLQLPPNIAQSAAFTFAAWVYWDGGGNWQRIFDFGNDTSHYLFLTPQSGSGTLRFAIRNGGSEQMAESAGLPAGQWRHIALTLGGNTARIYVDGALAASSGSFSIAPSSFRPRLNYLGKSQFAADPLFKGRLDEVHIMDYALTQPQVARLATNLPPQFATNVIVRPSALAGMTYRDSIAGAATDTTPSDPLVYSKASGPAWLNVDASGGIGGTPGSRDLGANLFTVRATDLAGASAFAVLTIPISKAYPTNITGVLAGDTFTLSWPSTHVGCRLQVQTNSLGTNWITLPGTESTDRWSVPFDPATPSVYFRLVNPEIP